MSNYTSDSRSRRLVSDGGQMHCTSCALLYKLAWSEEKAGSGPVKNDARGKQLAYGRKEKRVAPLHHSAPSQLYATAHPR